MSASLLQVLIPNLEFWVLVWLLTNTSYHICSFCPCAQVVCSRVSPGQLDGPVGESGVDGRHLPLLPLPFHHTRPQQLRLLLCRHTFSVSEGNSIRGVLSIEGASETLSMMCVVFFICLYNELKYTEKPWSRIGLVLLIYWWSCKG